MFAQVHAPTLTQYSTIMKTCRKSNV
jgi:hypothetical protein